MQWRGTRFRHRTGACAVSVGAGAICAAVACQSFSEQTGTDPKGLHLSNEPSAGADAAALSSRSADFVSYASEDAQAAQQVCAALRAAGIEVWLDQSELRGGDSWDAAINRQIKSCALFIPLISANSRARVEGYFRLEWKLAVDRSHLMAAERTFLLPVVIDKTRDADVLVPDKFREVQWTHAPGGELPVAFVERIAHLLAPADRLIPSAKRAATATLSSPPRAKIPADCSPHISRVCAAADRRPGHIRAPVAQYVTRTCRGAAF